MNEVLRQEKNIYYLMISSADSIIPLNRCFARIPIMEPTDILSGACILTQCRRGISMKRKTGWR